MTGKIHTGGDWLRTPGAVRTLALTRSDRLGPLTMRRWPGDG